MALALRDVSSGQSAVRRGEPIPCSGPRLAVLLRQMIDDSGRSETDIARGAGIRACTLNRIAWGERRASLYVLIRIIESLRCSPADRDRLLIAAGYAPSWAGEDVVTDLVRIIRNGAPVDRDALCRMIAVIAERTT